jgi:hypothetical protein
MGSQLAALPNPFLEDVCLSPYGITERSSVNSLNRSLIDQISAAVEQLPASERVGKVGRPLTLITAPRAGYGKTHLLGRVLARADGTAVALPLIFRPDSDLSWAGVATELIEGLRAQPASLAGWSMLRELSAGVFSSAVVKLIEDGRLPCANKSQAIEVLTSRPTELFEEGTTARLIGDWLKRHFGALRKPLSDVLRRVPGVTQPEQWAEALFAQANLGTHASTETLAALATGGRTQFIQFLRLLCAWRPVFVFVDHLDGFYRQEQAGLKIAMMLLELSEINGLHTVLCMNQDLWRSTFSHHLPSAVEDRLTSSQVLLRGLDENEARGLLALRLQAAEVPADEARGFSDFMALGPYFSGRPQGAVSARAFLRHSAARWDRFVNLLAGGHDPQVALAEEQAAEPEAAADDAEVRLSPDEITATLSPIDTSYARRVASTLAEPVPAMVDSPFPNLEPSVEQAPEAEAAAEPTSMVDAPKAPLSLLDGPDSDFLQPAITAENKSVSDEPPSPEVGEAADASSPSDSSPFALAFRPDLGKPEFPATVQSTLTQSQPTVASGAVDRLRDMMDRLRQKTGSVPMPPASSQAGQRPDARMTAGVPAPVSVESQLEGRFEALRLQSANEAQHRPLDRLKLRDLIRLAGRRFPLVRYDEVPLANQPGQTVPRWSLQGLEIFFGLGDFMDRSYWRALSQLVLARKQTLTGQSAAQVKVKLVALKADRDSLAWTTLFNGNLLAPEVKERTEALHLDPRSVAALYAMQRIITDSESGSISAAPAQVMAVLARELDFFWKRVTRPL